jgi:hypothetical protein
MGQGDKEGRAGAQGIEDDKTGVEWVKSGLVGRVRYMRGEETLRHATLSDFREE